MSRFNLELFLLLTLVARHAAVEAPTAPAPAVAAFIPPGAATVDRAVAAALATEAAAAADIANSGDMTMEPPRAIFTAAVPVMDLLDQIAGLRR